MNLSAEELFQLAQAAGQGGDPRTAVAVALAESGGDPAAVGVNQDQWHSRDRGLWQINDHWHPDVSDACAFDPTCNAKAAFAISNGWTDFSPWSTYKSGAYQRFMSQTVSLADTRAPGRSLYGQSVVGQMLTSPWWAGNDEITQGWGPTDYGGEPEGHGYQHWHAGVDVGVPCGTTISLPMGLSGTARALDNPGGYGTALVILVDGTNLGVLLGHLRQRLVDDGTQVQGGAQLAVSNSTGNSTGCHVHFEVRPKDAKQPLGLAKYGTDVDPSTWITAGQPGTSADLLSSSVDPLAGLKQGASQALTAIVAGAEVLLGAAVLLTGLVVTAYGLRGSSPGQLQQDAGRQLRALRRPRAERRPQPRQRISSAAESRIRPDLQRPRSVAPGGQAGISPGERRRLGLPPAPRPARVQRPARPRRLISARSTPAERARETRMDEALAARLRARRRR